MYRIDKEDLGAPLSFCRTCVSTAPPRAVKRKRTKLSNVAEVFKAFEAGKLSAEEGMHTLKGLMVASAKQTLEMYGGGQ
jgi:hypothetical protein